MHYRAFISHSHADAKFAAWLQRAIETWRVPTRLRSELGYSRIKPIFRDRTDLRAATSLGDALEDALKHSSALIVVCSNEAADSDWVDQEIARYREFNPDAPILPIIASGEPPHCFPESLLVDANGNALEPLAADARKGFDGKRDALLKTIAGIIDVDFDVLKQRDFRRRQQKMGAVAALSTVIAAATLYLAYVAYEARDDANRRREQADDLIAFMLGDLREKLEPIGKLEILDAVGDEALDYFSELEGDELTPPVLLKHAIAMRQIGEVRMAQGNHDAALPAFGRSIDVLGSLNAEGFLHEEVAFELAQSNFWVGLVYLERNDLDDARKYFTRYLVIARELVRVDPKSSQYKGELYYALDTLGVLEVEAAEFDKAAEYLLKALEIGEELSENWSEIEYLEQRSRTISWLGEAEFRRGDLLAAAHWYAIEYDLLERLVEVSEDMDYRETFSHSARRLADTEMLLGNEQRTVELSSTAYQMASKLFAYDPENFYWFSAYMKAATSYSKSLEISGDNEKSANVIAAAVGKSEQLLSKTGARPDALADHILARVQLSRLQRIEGSLHESFSGLEQLLAQISSFGSGLDSWTAASLAQLHLLRGDLQFELGSREEAVNSWSKGLPLTQAEVQVKETPSNLLTRAELFYRLGMQEEAKTTMLQILAMGVSENYLNTFSLADVADGLSYLD